MGEGLEWAPTWQSGHRVATCLSPAWRMPGGEPCVFNAALRFFLPSVQMPSRLARVPLLAPPHTVHATTGPPLPSCACCAHLGACYLDGPCHCGAGGSCRTAPGPGEARWPPKGGTTLLVLLQRSRCWACGALAPPGHQDPGSSSQSTAGRQVREDR